MKVAFTVYCSANITGWIAKLWPYMKDCELVVFHVGGLQKEDFPELDGAVFCDIKGLSHTRVDRLVESLGIDLWIYLSYQSLLDLFLQRVCARRGIRRVYLQHGILTQGSSRPNVARARKEVWSALARQGDFWRKYAGLLLHRGNFREELNVLAQVYFKRDFSKSPFDRYLVFSQREKDVLSAICKPRDGDVTVVGYPLFADEAEKRLAAGARPGGEEVLYVHQPFILDGLTGISYEEERRYVLSIRDEVSRKYGGLAVLLHPRESLRSYRERFAGTGVEVVQSPGDYRCFAGRPLVLGHYSTALLYASYFRIPTLILEYPGVRNDPAFGNCFRGVARVGDLCAADAGVDSAGAAYMTGAWNTYEHVAGVITDIGRGQRPRQ